MKLNIIYLSGILCISIIARPINSSAYNGIASFIACDDNLHIKNKHKESLELCKQAYKVDKRNYEIIWRLARAYTGVGYNSGLSREEKEAYLEQALSLSEEAIRMKPDRPEGHFRLAITLGCFASIRGGKEKVTLAKRVKKELDATVKADPDYHMGYYGLGLWFREIAGLNKILRIFAKILYGSIPRGSFADAIINMKKCLELKNDYIEVWYELGRTYMKIENWQNAKSAFKKCISLNPYKADDKDFQKKSASLLVKVQKKLN